MPKGYKDLLAEANAVITAIEPAEAFIRPRMLTAASTKTVRLIGDMFKNAKPLRLQEKVASVE